MNREDWYIVAILGCLSLAVWVQQLRLDDLEFKVDLMRSQFPAMIHAHLAGIPFDGETVNQREARERVERAAAMSESGSIADDN